MHVVGLLAELLHPVTQLGVVAPLLRAQLVEARLPLPLQLVRLQIVRGRVRARDKGRVRVRVKVW